MKRLLMILIAACGTPRGSAPAAGSAASERPAAPVTAVVAVDASAADGPAGGTAEVAPDAHREDARSEPAGPPPSVPRATPGSALVEPGDVACIADRDCVIVPLANCCSCSSGGIGAVVHRRRAAAVKAKFASRCKQPAMCLAVISTDPTCLPSPVPACVDHVCALR